MTAYSLDIIIPVWNRPVEVRAALASFVAASPAARLVMVNNGSERETESILDEFAEALDDRALLVAADRNIGSVAAVNLGLSKSAAPLILVSSPFTRVDTGWFDAVAALFEHQPDVGSVVLRENRDTAVFAPIEADHGSFDAMILRRSLYDAIGGFAENMDGSDWTLRDFARRSFASEYMTYALGNRHIHLLEQREMGSVSRRAERARLARESYVSRWSEPGTFIVYCPASLFGLDVAELKGALLQSARQGNRLVVAVESTCTKLLLMNGFSAIHENIAVHALPRFFTRKAFSRVIDQTAISAPTATLVSETGIPDSRLQSVTFADFLELNQQRSTRYYQR